MKITVEDFSALSGEQIDEWRGLQQSAPECASPFYAPEFAGAISAAGMAVEVAVMRANGRTVGVLPFHRRALSVGTNVGGQICDFQGIVGAPGQTIDTKSLLNGCGLDAYDFNHLPVSQSTLAAGAYMSSTSPYIDLSEGFDAYFAARAAAGTKELKATERKLRKIEREVGPLRFEMNDPADAAWRALLDWKSLAYKKMGGGAVNEKSWAIQTLRNIRDIETDTFAGMLTTAYAGDQLIAVHFGMRSCDTLHWWFPTYDPAFHKYSPGLLLLLELARRAASEGIVRIDLGRGDERYKSSFASGATMLAEGSIERPVTIAGCARRARKLIHRATDGGGKLQRMNDFQRRAFNRIFQVGNLPE